MLLSHPSLSALPQRFSCHNYRHLDLTIAFNCVPFHEPQLNCIFSQNSPPTPLPFLLHRFSTFVDNSYISLLKRILEQQRLEFKLLQTYLSRLFVRHKDLLAQTSFCLIFFNGKLARSFRRRIEQHIAQIGRSLKSNTYFKLRTEFRS
jgi:hypothetical protein